ncbi:MULTISPECIES: putative bifunctional diguanylate cyclase/phosphodiesterase [unclassified Agarivorans]|uniref:putative bifunctional diguanylate cyclase/phosphodiesterase n=1 Tax=unclassified Agarivorans TaxID=2636026 RepID=UPI0026E3BC62|nr:MULTISPECIES: EAL domain-containing protein [unclassified Agarivorans]MDO6684780.1 EAL domain-containing protein [Agarivorans sp. 3_MG-2023]MDO6715059.1 EAL domain-containing protein [Agarivorans sp. 2_MG-2023]MDO6764022.1 EAL domain-containing protein [Agarivorans sp. 1_MG-2023]
MKLSKFPLINLKQRYISVRLKMTVALVLAAGFVVSIFGFTAMEHYQNQQAQLKLSYLDNYALEFNDQIERLSDSITYLFEAQTLFSKAENMSELEKYLTRQLPELQWLLPIVNGCTVFEVDNYTCSASDSPPPKELLEQVTLRSKPMQLLQCSEMCYLWISLPIRTRSSEQGILAFQLELADALIKVTQRDDIELAIVDLDRPLYKSILLATNTQALSQQWFDSAIEYRHHANMEFQVEHKTIVGKLYPIKNSASSTLKLVILKDWSDQIQLQTRFENQLSILLLLTMALSIAIGLMLMRRPLNKLRYHAASLPTILEDESYKPQNNLHLFNDEFDSLDHISIELADSFSEMRSSIAANTKVLEKMAMEDPLTELPNRTAFLEQLSKALKEAERQGDELSLIYIDLDNFKTINDTLGHDFGDLLLVQVAKRIMRLSEFASSTFRLGGDEFTLLINKKDKDSVLGFAYSLAQEISRDITISGVSMKVTLSIGIATAKQAEYEPQLLVKYADLAMYSSKRKGRNCCTHFDIELARQNDMVFTIENQFQNAMSNNELELYLQPQVSMKQQAVTGFELLLRWNHPTQGLMNPGQFLDTVESGRHILPLGYWVIDKSLALLEELNTKGYSGLTIAFNISGRQFEDKNFAQKLISKYKTISIGSNLLELEITESVAVQNYQQVKNQLNEIRGAGIRVAFDDFGKGFTSLSYLSNLACDKIKFDREFGHNAITSVATQNIVLSMRKLMYTLDYEILVEGVETLEHANWLKQNGFDKVQGYFFGHPVTKEAALEFYLRCNEKGALLDKSGNIIHLHPLFHIPQTSAHSNGNH